MNLNHLPPSPKKNSVLFISRPVLQKIVLNYDGCILNFINKNCVEYCFLSYYVSTGIISLIWPPVLHSLEYLPSGLKRWQTPVLGVTSSVSVFWSAEWAWCLFQRAIVKAEKENGC